MFIAGAFGLVLFLSLFGGLFLWLAKNEAVAAVGPESKFFKRLVNIKTIMVLFALFYFALAHFTMYGALALSVEYDNNAPCENIPINSTVSGNVTYYSYVDSCAALTTPEILVTYFTVFTWLLYVDMLTIFFGCFVLIFKFFGSVL